jgi:hypothetical protein
MSTEQYEVRYRTEVGASTTIGDRPCPTLGEACDRAEDVAETRGFTGGEWEWRTVNDGTGEFDRQVYELWHEGKWTRFSVHGPHVSKEEQ